MKRATRILALIPLASSVSLGNFACGSDEDKRGLQPSGETAVPFSNTEDAMTEAERRKQQVDQMEKAEGVE